MSAQSAFCSSSQSAVSCARARALAAALAVRPRAVRRPSRCSCRRTARSGAAAAGKPAACARSDGREAVETETVCCSQGMAA